MEDLEGPQPNAVMEVQEINPETNQVEKGRDIATEKQRIKQLRKENGTFITFLVTKILRELKKCF